MGPFVPCDACGHRAYVIVRRQYRPGAPVAELALCGHHFNEHEAQLLAEGFEVTEDNRAELAPRREEVAA